MLDRMPSRLYRYVGVSGDRMEWLRQALLESRLYFTPPSNFNDPLDCRVPLSFDASSLKTKHHWRQVAKNDFSGEPVRHRKEEIQGMVRLSQTESGRNELTERVYKALDTVGILSLSKREANMLMWSYYAEGHKGVAIRFNMAPEHLLVIPARFMPVELKYCTQFPRINYFNSTLPDFVLGIL